MADWHPAVNLFVENPASQASQDGGWPPKDCTSSWAFARRTQLPGVMMWVCPTFHQNTRRTSAMAARTLCCWRGSFCASRIGRAWRRAPWAIREVGRWASFSTGVGRGFRTSSIRPSLVIAINSWPLGLAQIPWPHPNSYARPRCDPKTARLNTRNRLLIYCVRQLKTQ